MYSACKKIVLGLLPQRFKQRNEQWMRQLAALPYTGTAYRCNLCNKQLRVFVRLSHDLLCPACGSLSRTRQLWAFLKNSNLLSGTVLHFSPSPALHKQLSQLDNISYVSTDYSGEFPANRQYDLTDLQVTTASINLIICYHVLEHIQDDKIAMRELYRALAPQGTLLIQTPFKADGILEDPLIITPQDRLQFYGQEDHVRIYSAQGLIDRFKETTGATDVKAIDLPAIEKNGILDNQVIVIKKTTAAAA